MSLSLISTSGFVIIIGLVITFISFFDNSIGSSFLYSYQDRISFYTLSYLILIFVVNIIGQIFLVYLLIDLSKAITQLKRRSITVSHFLIVFSIIANVVVFFSLISGSLQNNRYDLSLYVVFVIYNLSSSVIIVGILVFKLISWLRQNKNLFVFLYGIAFAIFFLATSSALATILLEIEGRSSSFSAVPNPWDISSMRPLISSDIYRASSLAMFALVWFATALMLRGYSLNYTKRVGVRKYWILVSLPLLYFLASSDFVVNQLSAFIFQYPSISTLIVYSIGGTKQVGGLFFAISFILMSRNSSNMNLKIFLSYSASGIMMLFSSLQISVLALIPYPAFGLTTLSIMPVASYLLLIGLYYSALSIAYDRQVLLSLKKRVKDDTSAFLSGIGSAEWSKNIESTVDDVIRRAGDSVKQIDSELSSEDIQKYLKETIQEIEQSKVKKRES